MGNYFLKQTLIHKMKEHNCDVSSLAFVCTYNRMKSDCHVTMSFKDAKGRTRMFMPISTSHTKAEAERRCMQLAITQFDIDEMKSRRANK